MHRVIRCLAIFAVALAAACASTPEDRIEANPEAFAKLPPDVQNLIRAGQVGIGFNEDEVHLAIGDPDRVTERTDAQGKSQVWRYVEYEDDTGALLYTGYYHHYYTPYYAPFYGPASYPYFLDSPSRRERDVMRVTFREGLVTSVERELK